ncbi:MAG: sugar phosphate isomerase/epimerase [Verrucomicrobia bacterium]|nr:MAG: sugar phosphate isomerase/epimerase [Verrucomicrobiota bacterium]TAE85800.1 MAG: sugar phosphate isomerase/epimerase [Verrucomicrobiota bacterium]TAF23221.1 MAG: sugar phosphate isomerase/epimerase [Verrucomicrobiota bacterium]TAF40048.1 MAG: sugar phosphate isomerase/epimerase [Verrucomicrobiota bacterium]
MSVTFGASTWLWTSPFTSNHGDLLRGIAKLGFDAVELPIEDPDLVDPSKIRPILEECGLTPYLCGAFGPGRDLTNADASVRANTRAYLSRLMDLAEALGTPFIAGPMYAQVGKARQLSPDDRQREWDLAASELRSVASEAGQRGLKLAIEAINRFESDLVNTTADTIRLVRSIDHPAAKAMIDTFHMTIEEADIGAAIRHAGNDLIHVQVSENHRGVTGTGLTPWQDFRDALKDIDYSGAVVIESFTPDNRDLAGAVCIWKRFTATQDEFAARGLAFLQDLFNQPAKA